MEIMQREVQRSYVPQDVQVALDTILSYCYHVNLENQILTKRLDDITKFASPEERENAIALAHKTTYDSESKRISAILTRSKKGEGSEVTK